MKHVVLTDTMSSAAIRPPDTFAELRKVSIEDAREFLLHPADLREIDCPACGAAERVPAFQKHGFSYQQCRTCGSVYVSPRPTEPALQRYYLESSAARLRVDYFTQESAAARFDHVIESRVDWIAQLLDRNGSRGRHFADYGTLYPSLFAEVARLGRFNKLYCVEPPERVASLVESGGVTVGWPEAGTVRAASVFEQLEHQAAPHAFLEAIRDLLAPGGVAFVTTRTISGFDLQTLWGKAPYIFAPDHLNLLSVEGLTTLFESAGFELIELSTPGQLDVEMVLDASRDDEAIQLPAFVRYLLDHRNADSLADFQAFLQRNRLSSHVRVAARRI
jgi:hypothetical protein